MIACSHCDREFETSRGATIHSISRHGLPYDSANLPETPEHLDDSHELGQMDDDTLGFTAELVAECIAQGLPYDEGAVASLLTECAGRLREG